MRSTSSNPPAHRFTAHLGVGVALTLGLLSQGCVSNADDDTEFFVDETSAGKEDGAATRYVLIRSEDGYRPLDERAGDWSPSLWSHGLFEVTKQDDGRYAVAGPWYKVNLDPRAPTSWRVDIRRAEGEDRLADVPDKGVAFYVAWRNAGADNWSGLLHPEVTTELGSTSSSGLYSSFHVGPGALAVTSPMFTGQATSDFVLNDAEFAIIPVPYDLQSKLPGVGQFEISISDSEGQEEEEW